MAKRKLPPHIVLPDGRWRFVKKGTKTIKKTTRKRTVMARRKSYRSRVYARARRGYKSRKGLLGGNTGNMVIGAVAGAVSNMIPDLLGGWTKPVVFGAGAYLLKKPALFTIAGYEAGKMITSGGLFNFGNNGGDLL